MPLTRQMIAALRGQGGLGAPQAARLVTPRTSSETSLVGDRQIPIQGRTITPIQGVRGGFDVAIDGNSVGQLLRGGPNGRFVSNGAAIAAPALQPGQMGTRSLTPNAPPMQQRQYAPNPFQQQMMQAQMLRNRPIK